ncbi:NAD(P)-binding protein [Actinokineospora guangxiensis]|uniref:NAD(P)-binding protein n=1 Tax=Actinokineospora guangxiensis TaxID=1490288 RepID=A0ABW0EL04_9PSEU
MLAVVGSGLSGAAAARLLQLHGVEHVLVERGPNLGVRHVGSDERTAHLENPREDPSFRAFDIGASSPYAPTAGYRSRVGGRGLYWRGICLRIEPEALASWPDGPREALLSEHYGAAEETLARWVGRPLAAARSATEQRLVQTLSAAGYSATATPRAVRFSDGGWSAYSPIAELSAARIRPDRQVTSVVRRPGRGFVLRGPAHELVVDGVIFAAGVFENVRLVAGLTGADQAAKIVDHVASGFLVFGPGGEHDTVDASAYAGFHRSAGSNLFVESGAVDGGTMIDAWAMGEQPPDAASVLSGGAVALDARARHRLDDVEARQRRLLDDAAARLGFSAPRWAGLDFDAASRRARREPGVAIGYRAGIGELDHESCGLPVGGELVDDDGRLRAAPDAYVVGPCLFPRAGAANPTLTTLALTHHVIGAVLADQL